MWERLAVALFFLFVAFLGIGGCRLIWRKAKGKRREVDVDKALEIVKMVQLPPLDLARLKERILRDIKVYRRGGGYYLTTHQQGREVIQEPKKPDVVICDRYDVACVKRNCLTGSGEV